MHNVVNTTKVKKNKQKQNNIYLSNYFMENSNNKKHYIMDPLITHYNNNNRNNGNEVDSNERRAPPPNEINIENEVRVDEQEELLVYPSSPPRTTSTKTYTSSRIVKGLFSEYENNSNNPVVGTTTTTTIPTPVMPHRPLSAYTNLGSPLASSSLNIILPTAAVTATASSSSSSSPPIPTTTSPSILSTTTTTAATPNHHNHRLRSSTVRNTRNRSNSLGCASTMTGIGWNHPHPPFMPPFSNSHHPTSSPQPWNHSPRNSVMNTNQHQNPHPSFMIPPHSSTSMTGNGRQNMMTSTPKSPNVGLFMIDTDNVNDNRCHDNGMVSEGQRHVIEMASSKERQRIKQCEVAELNINNVDELKHILKKERYRTINIVIELNKLKYISTSNQFNAEVLEESRINTLMKRINTLQHDKEDIINQLEREEEMVRCSCYIVSIEDVIRVFVFTIYYTLFYVPPFVKLVLCNLIFFAFLFLLYCNNIITVNEYITT